MSQRSIDRIRGLVQFALVLLLLLGGTAALGFAVRVFTWTAGW